MASVVAANLSVSFGEAEDRGGRIILQQLTKQFGQRGSLAGRCFSRDTVQYTASVGTVERGKMYERQVNSESIEFSNSSSATLKYPGAYAVSILQSVFLRQVTVGSVTRIEPVSVALSYDAATESVVTTDGLPVYGKASVSYKVLYEVFYYFPFSQYLGWSNGVTILEIGTVFAYNDSVVETLDMELDMSMPKDWVEYARVVSKIVLDPKGTWEFPPNWATTYNDNREKQGDERDDYPADGTFSNTSDTVDATNCFVDERVHLIVEVNTLGVLNYRDFNNGGDGYWAWENPWFGYDSYDPVYEIRIAEPPGGSKASNAEEFKRDLNNRTWRTVFLDVNKTEVIAKIQEEYPGASEYSRNR